MGEQKTKPTQHSVQVLRSLGITPTLIACRSQEPLEESVRTKLVSAAAAAEERKRGREGLCGCMHALCSGGAGGMVFALFVCCLRVCVSV